MRKDKFVFPPTPLRPHAQLTTTLTPTHSQYVFPTYNFSPIQLPPNLSSRFPSNLSSRFPPNLSSRFPSNLSSRFPSNHPSGFHPISHPGFHPISHPGFHPITHPVSIQSLIPVSIQFFSLPLSPIFFLLISISLPTQFFPTHPSQPSPDFSSFQLHHIFSPVFIHLKIRPILPSSSSFPILFLFFLLPNSFPLLPSR